MWLCRVDFPGTPLRWASPTDQSGSYGLTKVTCTPVYFGQAPDYGPLSLWRAAKRLWEILQELPP